MRLYIYSAIMFCNYFITGLTIPVQALVFIEKGLTMTNISMIFGLYSFTVIALELPSGVASDMLGRKNTYLAALAASVAGYGMIAASSSLAAVAGGMIIYGIGRALSSGSFDALFIDWHTAAYGSHRLPKVTMILSVCECLGLSAGSLAGGFLPNMTSLAFMAGNSQYNVNIHMRNLFTVLLILVTLFYVRETQQSHTTGRPGIREHIWRSKSTVTGSKRLMFIFISVFATGFFLFTLETYWQPHFKSILQDDSLIWLLGVLSFLYFAASMSGVVIYNGIFKKSRLSIETSYIALKIITIGVIIVMTQQASVPGFMIMYTVTYMFMGMTNMPESIIINSEVPSDTRASILSLNSMIMQAGCLTASCICTIMAAYMSIPGIWLTSAIVLAAALAAACCVLKGRKKQKMTAP